MKPKRGVLQKKLQHALKLCIYLYSENVGAVIGRPRAIENRPYGFYRRICEFCTCPLPICRGRSFESCCFIKNGESCWGSPGGVIFEDWFQPTVFDCVLKPMDSPTALKVSPGHFYPRLCRGRPFESRRFIKKRRYPMGISIFFGDPPGTRTQDTRLKRAVLYRLS